MVIRNVSYIAFNEKTQEIVYLKTGLSVKERQILNRNSLGSGEKRKLYFEKGRQSEGILKQFMHGITLFRSRQDLT